MNLSIGIIHKKYGHGNLIYNDDEHITIKFDNEEEKKFRYDAFGTFLEFDSETTKFLQSFKEFYNINSKEVDENYNEDDGDEEEFFDGFEEDFDDLEEDFDDLEEDFDDLEEDFDDLEEDFDDLEEVINESIRELEYRDKEELCEVNNISYRKDYILRQNNLLRTDPTYINMRRKEERKLREIREQRNINYFVHFTRIENIPSILENGIVPIQFQSINNINSIHNDQKRLDKEFDKTSFSIEFPNYKLLRSFKNKYPETIWVIVFIKSDILFSKNNISYFYHTNAAGIKTDLDGGFTAEALENMFADVVKKKYGDLVDRNSLRIRSNLPTDPQAEILISHTISKDYISHLSFENNDHFLKFLTMYGFEFLKKTNFKIERELFFNRKDSRYW